MAQWMKKALVGIYSEPTKHYRKKRLRSPIYGAPSILIRISVTSLVCFSGCGNDRIAQPGQDRTLLFASYNTGVPQGQIAVVDVETDSVVESLTDSSFGYIGRITATQDGTYLMITGERLPQIWSPKSRSTVAWLESDVHDVIYAPDENVLVGIAADVTYFYDYQGFVLQEAIPVSLISGRRVANNPYIVGIDRKLSPVENRSIVMIINFITRETVDSVVVDSAGWGAPFQFLGIETSPDGSLLYGWGGINTGAGERGPTVICYNLSTRMIQFTRDINAVAGDLRATPDGDELWVTLSGVPLHSIPPNPGSILVLDAQTGHQLDSITTDGYSSTSGWRVNVKEIQFAEVDGLAFVNSIFNDPILVIGVESHTILRSILGGQNRSYTSIEVVYSED